MAYMHRISTVENATAVKAPVKSENGVRVFVGTAPVHTTAYGTVNEPVLVNSFEEAVKYFGYSEDYAKYTLCEAMDACFKLYNIAPVVFINVYDPTKGKSAAAAPKTVNITEVGVVDTTLTNIALGSVTIKPNNGEEIPAKASEDFELFYDTDGKVKLRVKKIQSGVTSVALKYTDGLADVTAVSANDIIGGYDVTTGATKGIEAIRNVYPKLGVIPSILACPKFGGEPLVALALSAKTEDLNGLYSCECVLDLLYKAQATKLTTYADVETAKKYLGVTNPHAMAFFPCVKVGGKVFHLSTLAACAMAKCDMDHGDIPYKSPSSESIPVSATCLSDGTEVFLDVPQAELVNGLGVVTAINDNGFKLYGNNTTAYSKSTDPKDRWIACRRMMSWYRNRFIQTYKNKVDEPANYRLSEAVVDSENIFLNSLKAAGIIAGGRLSFDEAENPKEAILDGKIVFSTKIAFFTPAEWIVDHIEFDPTLISSAVGGNN